MKIALKFILAIGISASLVFVSGCSKKSTPAPSVKDQQLALLSKSVWKLTAVTKDNVSQSADYPSTATLTITGTPGQDTFHYTWALLTSGKKYPFVFPTGTFVFDATNPATTVVMDADYNVTYAVTTNQLIISFNYTGTGATFRSNVVTGAWQFTFSH